MRARWRSRRHGQMARRCSGPAEAALAVLRGRHRFRLLVKAARGLDLPGYLRAWIAAAPPPRGGVERHVDVEPQSFV